MSLIYYLLLKYRSFLFGRQHPSKYEIHWKKLIKVFPFGLLYQLAPLCVGSKAYLCHEAFSGPPCLCVHTDASCSLCILQCVYNTPDMWSLVHFPHIILVVCVCVYFPSSTDLFKGRDLVYFRTLDKDCHIARTSECFINE